MLSCWVIGNVAHPVEPVTKLKDADEAGTSEEAEGPACRVQITLYEQISEISIYTQFVL